jgi:hypothetical protein
VAGQMSCACCAWREDGVDSAAAWLVCLHRMLTAVPRVVADHKVVELLRAPGNTLMR